MKLRMTLLQHSVNSDWLLNTQSRVLQADWFILEINEKVTVNIETLYSVPNNNEVKMFLSAVRQLDLVVFRTDFNPFWNLIEVTFLGLPDS